MRRILRVVLLTLVVAYVGLMVLALLSDRVIFQPHPSSYQLAELGVYRIPGLHTVMLPSGNAQIAAVYLPNPSARYTLLFSHGNAEDIGDDLPMLAEFRNAGFAVFAYDYRGYGVSTGRSSEKSVYEDVDAAYRYLTETLNVPPDRVISFGRSLGCAAAIQLASTKKVAGLIVESPFLSAFRVLTRVRLLPWDRFDNAAKIRRVHCPVLVMHGRRDQVVPWWHGERIYALANEPKQFLWVDAAGHNDVQLSSKYIPALTGYEAMLRTNSR